MVTRALRVGEGRKFRAYEKRVSAYPSLSTTAEQGFPTVRIGHWAGLFAPRDTPRPIIERMNAGKHEARKAGRRTDGRIPYGYRRTSSCQLAIVDSQAGKARGSASLLSPSKARMNAS